MIQTLTLLLPICLAGAISPVLLTEQTVLLAGPGGRRAARGFAIGAMVTLTLIALVLVLFGHAIKLPARPALSATLDVVFGLALVAAGVIVHAAGQSRARNPAPVADEAGTHGQRSRAAIPFGAFSMATNFTTLALVLVAAKEIAAADVETIGRLFLVLVLVVICSLPAWAPIALTMAAPRAGEAALDRLGRFIDRYGRTAVVVLLVVGGIYLLARGIVHL